MGFYVIRIFGIYVKPVSAGIVILQVFVTGPELSIRRQIIQFLTVEVLGHSPGAYPSQKLHQTKT